MLPAEHGKIITIMRSISQRSNVSALCFFEKSLKHRDDFRIRLTFDDRAMNGFDLC